MSRKRSKRPSDYAPYAGQKHVFLFTDVLESPAYSGLSSDAKVLLIQLGYEWGKTINGAADANGHFQFSTSRIQAVLGGCASRRATNAFRELVEHGFVEIMELENWVQRDARKLRLTWLNCRGEWPTKDWKRWKSGLKIFEVPQHRNAKSKAGHSKQQSTHHHIEGQCDSKKGSQWNKAQATNQQVSAVVLGCADDQFEGEYISPSLLLKQEINSHA
jgi:hypothetical protein